MKRNACRKTLVVCLSLLILLFTAIEISLAAYPEKPITLIMSWPAGGGTDVSLRPLVEAASKILGQPITMEYHPGGAEAVGVGLLKTKKSDGYTIGNTAGSSINNKYLRKVPCDLVKDFTHIMQYAEYTFGLTVLSSSPWQNMNQFLEFAKANPGKIRYSSAGPGTAQVLAMEKMAQIFKIEWKHVPFEGGPPALAALLGGHVEAYTTTMQCKPHILAGRIRLLATYGEKRSDSFPDVPCTFEIGAYMKNPSCMGIIAPKGVSPEKVEILHQAFKKAMNDPAFIRACKNVDHEIVYRSPKDMTKYLTDTDEEIRKLLVDLKMIKD